MIQHLFTKSDVLHRGYLMRAGIGTFLKKFLFSECRKAPYYLQRVCLKY